MSRLIGFFLALVFATSAAAAPPPIEAYGQLPAIEQVDISPGGHRLAYLTRRGAQRELVVQTLTGQTLAAVNIGDAKVRSVEWADDRYVLIVTSVTTAIPWVMAMREELQTAQAFDVEKRRFTPLLSSTREAALNVLMGAPAVRVVDGKTRVFVEGLTVNSGVHLFEVNLDTGFSSSVDEGGGRVAARVLGPEGKVVARSTYDAQRGRWALTANEGVRWPEIYVDENAKLDVPSLAGLGRDGASVVFMKDEAAGGALYEVPLKGGAPKLVVRAVGLRGPIHHPVTLRLTGYTVLQDDSVKHTFFEPSLDAAHRKLSASFKGKRISLTSTTPDRTKMIVLTEGPTDAGTYYLADLAASQISMLGPRYPEIGADQLGTVRYIRYKAADGLEIPAYLTLPPGREAKGLPLVVLPHGGPQARDEPGFDWFSQVFASRGYAVLQPQFRGSDGYGRPFVEAGYGQWGRKMQTDLSDGVRSLASQGVVDPKRVCIFGWSYGGYAAMAGPTIDPGVYRCAVAGAGVADLNRMVRWSATRTGGRDTPTVRYWKRFMGANRIGDKSLDEVSPALQAARADAPILLIHGKDDTVVPYEQTQIMARALERHNKPYELVTLGGEDHWLSQGATRTQALTAAVSFIEKHNPPR